MLTSRSSLLTPAVRAFTTSFLRFRRRRRRVVPESLPRLHPSCRQLLARLLLIVVLCSSSSLKKAAASSSSINKSSFCFRAMISSTSILGLLTDCLLQYTQCIRYNQQKEPLNVKSTMIDTILQIIAPHHCYGCGKTGILYVTIVNTTSLANHLPAVLSAAGSRGICPN